jgi:hypothetical protein
MLAAVPKERDAVVARGGRRSNVLRLGAKGSVNGATCARGTTQAARSGLREPCWSRLRKIHRGGDAVSPEARAQAATVAVASSIQCVTVCTDWGASSASPCSVGREKEPTSASHRSWSVSVVSPQPPAAFLAKGNQKSTADQVHDSSSPVTPTRTAAYERNASD